MELHRKTNTQTTIYAKLVTMWQRTTEPPQSLSYKQGGYEEQEEAEREEE